MTTTQTPAQKGNSDALIVEGRNARIAFDRGYDLVLKEGRNPKAPPEVKDGKLPLGEIQFATSVFQPRTGKGTAAASAAHTAALADAIRSSPTHLLDPITVWWSGRKWRVVDGHHRMMAYRQVSDPAQQNAAKRCIPIREVPVEVFSGSLDEAIEFAAKANAKDKLTMSKTDKLETAWKLTVLGTLSIPRIARATTVGERTISRMRETLAELTKVEPGDFGPKVNVRTLTWAQAKAELKGEREIDDDWVERTAEEWAKRLAKTFGTKLRDSPELALRALEIYSEGLPERLTALWRDESDAEREEE